MNRLKNHAETRTLYGQTTLQTAFSMALCPTKLELFLMKLIALTAVFHNLTWKEAFSLGLEDLFLLQGNAIKLQTEELSAEIASTSSGGT